MKLSKYQPMILLTLFGFAGSVLIGFLFYDIKIFVFKNPAFQFIVIGFFGSVFFSLLKYRSIRDQLFGIAIIIFWDFVVIIGKPLSTAMVVRDIMFLSSMFLSVSLYYNFIKRKPNMKYFIRSFTLGIIYSLLTILFGTVVYFINAQFNFPPSGFLYAIAKNSLLTGAGIGIGLDFYLHYENQILKFLKVSVT
jgi:hypothetical protein